MKGIKDKLIKIVRDFKGKKIKIIGDIILDEYVFGEVERISPEAPVPVVLVKEKRYNLGGAANVAFNIKELGGEPELFGVTGNDESARFIEELLIEKKIYKNGLIKLDSRPTTRKTRVIGQNQQIVRIDEEVTEFIKKRERNLLMEKIFENNDSLAIIFEDYEKGTISRELVKNVVKENKEKIITCDPKKHNFSFYKNINVLKPNRKELEFVSKKEIRNKKDMIKEIVKLSKNLNIPIILLTLGEEGMILKEKDIIYDIPSLKVEVYDVTGAGDTVISSFTLSLVSGATPLEAAIISTIAAGIEVTKLGASAVSTSELIEAIEKRGDEIFESVKRIE